METKTDPFNWEIFPAEPTLLFITYQFYVCDTYQKVFIIHGQALDYTYH